MSIHVPWGGERSRGEEENSERIMWVLVANGVRRYRLIVDGELVYAFGKINFDLNWPKDGTGKSFGDYSFAKISPVEKFLKKKIYASYSDGFYEWTYDDEGVFTADYVSSIYYYWFSKTHDDLTDFISKDIFRPSLIEEDERTREKIFHWYWTNSTYVWPLKFRGWYTKKEGGSRIETIDHIAGRTDLFKFHEEEKMPEITLYAHWEVPTFTITVENIERSVGVKVKKNGEDTIEIKKVHSSFLYKGKKRVKSVPFQVPYGTEIISYIKKQGIDSPQYITWARGFLDSTKYKEKLRAGPQKFLGWSIKGSENNEDENNYYLRTGYTETYKKLYATKRITLVPQFESIAIWKKSSPTLGKKYKGKTYGGKFETFKKGYQFYTGTGGSSASFDDEDIQQNGGSSPYFNEGIRYSHGGLDSFETIAPKVPESYDEYIGSSPNWDHAYHYSYRWECKYCDSKWNGYRSWQYHGYFSRLSSTTVFNLEGNKWDRIKRY